VGVHLRGGIPVAQSLPAPEVTVRRVGSGAVKDERKTKAQLLDELADLRRQIADLRDRQTSASAAEEALRESEARYRAVVEDQTELICRFTPDRRVTFMNEALRQFIGKTAEELGQLDFGEFIHGDDRQTVLQRIASLSPERPSETHENRAVASGKVRWLQWTNRGIFDDQGRLLEIQAVGRDITERKRAEEAHRKAADELSLILGSVTEHVILHDPSMRIVWVSRAAAESVHAAPEQLKGRHCYELWQQRHTPCEGCPVRKAIRTGTPHRREMTTPDGRVWDVRGYPVYGDDSAVAGAVEVTLDITERKRAEEALRQSEANYRAIFDAAGDALFVHDIETGDVVDLNQKASELYGYRPDEIDLLNAQFRRQTLPPYSYQDQMRRLRQAAEQGPQLFEWLATDRNGRRFWVEVSLKRAVIRGGDRLLAVLRDIEDRKRAEEGLRRSEENYRVLFQESLDGILVIADGCLVSANPAAADIYAMPLRQLVGRDIMDLVPPEEQDAVARSMQSVLAGKPDPERDRRYRVQRADGTIGLIEVLSKRIDWEGRPAVQAIIRDVTQRVRLEEELRQAQKMEAIGLLAGGIAHDFSNLMTGILCHADLLKAENPSPEDVREAATLIEGAAQRATELTSQLLGFARRGARQDVTVDLNATVETTVRFLSRSLDPRIRVSTRFCREKALVQGDPVQMEQVVLNLAMNARDAMPDGGQMTFIVQTLDVGTEDCIRRPGAEPGRYVALGVEDTGRGMSEATRGRVFEPFFTTKPPGKGTGMGLAMVYGIVKDHGGWVEVDSEPGRGTTFRVFLPAAEPAEVAEAPPARPPSASDTDH